MRILSGLFLLFLALNIAPSAGYSADRKVLTDAVAPTFVGGQPRKTGSVIRQELTKAEFAANQPVHFVLRMRNFDELQARVERGDIISRDEMVSRYLPTHETWMKVAAWARAQGFAVKDEDSSRMTVFARSSVTQVEVALQMKFARVVGTDGKEYTSGITPPSIPAELGDDVVGVRKLQPHLRPIHSQTITPISPATGTISPTTIAQLYNASGLGVDGAGQTLVVVGYGPVSQIDLATFWTTCSLPTTVAQFTEVDPDGPPSASDSSMEETLDIEWSSAMAPGARIVYFSSLDPEVLESWLFDRQATDHSIHQVNESFGLPEPYASQIATTSQCYVAMAAIGVTYFAATGDYGSTAGLDTASKSLYYDPSGMTAPGYPASDPYVTAVGGTTVGFGKSANGSPILPVTEGGWCFPNGDPLSLDWKQYASTGGISLFFPRPSWQTGANIPSGGMRCVPDVAAMAMGNFLGYICYNGSAHGIGGASQSSPIWTGFCALINEARSNAGLSPMGLLGPKVYPLISTSAFNQMTTGSAHVTDGFSTTATNGAYNVGPNYNMVTGLGSPNVGNIIAALTTAAAGTAPAITTQPAAHTVAQGGTVTFTVAASGTPAPSYRWTINGMTVSDGTQPDDSIASGATTNTLTISNAQTTGTVVAIASNANGVALSNAVTLTVNLPTSPYGLVTTLAGSGVAGSIDGYGTGIGASFQYPQGVAVDSSGNVYVADFGDNKIRKVSPAGMVTTLAGSGSRGSADGTGTAASFNGPEAVAVDSSGNVYVADTSNHKIRKVTPTGVVTTLAGSGSEGSTDGTGTSASFTYPSGVAVDSSGNVYVADSGNNKIRKVSPAGVVTTLAGSGSQGSTDGTGTSASFSDPSGVSVDSSGNVYVADTFNHKIRKVTPAGVVTTLAGNGSSGSINGTGTGASFDNPAGLSVDSSGSVYVADSGNNKIRKVSPAGLVTTLAGSDSQGSTDGTGTAASFNDPEAVAVDSSGNVYVADCRNAEIRKASPAGVVTTVAGDMEGSPGVDGIGELARFNTPGDVAVDASGNMYVADSGNNKIRKVDSAGMVTTLAGSGSAGSTNGTGTAASFNNPTGLAVDGSGNIYVTDSDNNLIRKVTSSGVVTTLAGSGYQGSKDDTGTAASFNWPTGPAVDAAGNVYVADQSNQKIRKVTPAGLVTTMAGSGSKGWMDGTGTAASFDYPSKVAVDASENVYEADSGSCEIRKISPTGVVLTIAGSAYNAGGSTDGSGADASFSSPAGLAVDAAGNVYVADSDNNEIRKISPDGAVITLAGNSVKGSTDGAGTAARFDNPQGVTVDASGNIYVADFGNNKIRKIVQIFPVTPVITWPAPAAITYGTQLSATQLDATASVPGTFIYTPDAWTVLAAGQQTLSVKFTPTDATNYTTATATQKLTVNKAVPAVTWAAPAAITYGTALSSAQLNATASVPGTFVYTPAAGTALASGTQTLSVKFTPTDATNYTTATATQKLTVNKAVPAVTWATPAAITYGTALSSAQLNATADVPGTFVYTPAAGTVLASGTQTLTVKLTPTDATDYATVTATQKLTVNKAVPSVTWPVPAAITYGTALSSAQLDATASVPGAFVYTPAAGTVITAGQQPLSVNFTPTDATDYATATATQKLTVNKAVPSVTWPVPAAITYGTALSSAQLDATASVPGAFVYTPAAGTVLTAGQQPLSVTFTPTDTTDYTTTTATQKLTVNKAVPSVTWPVPAAITYGTALSSAQLDATASVPGAFVYSPAAGTVLTGGVHPLGVKFTPTDATDYATVVTIQKLTVNKAVPVITWPVLPTIASGTALSSAQLNATANMPGAFVYSPTAGAVLDVGTHALKVTFTPTDTTDYSAIAATQPLIVTNKIIPVITWPAPAAITYGIALSSAQLNATANVPGAFVYSPAAGTVLNAGTQSLNVKFTPTNTTDYSATAAPQTLIVGKAAQTITFPAPANRHYGDPSFNVSASASSGLPVTFAVLSGPATITGNKTVTLTGGGTVVLAADQAGNANYSAAPEVPHSFTVIKATGTVTLTPGSLSATYDGKPHSVTATTTPAGLAVIFTYNGSATAPTNAGSYAVVGTINDANYQGKSSGTNTLVIAKAAQTIAFPAIANRHYGNAPFKPSATASSGLAVTYSIVSGPATISNGAVALTGVGTVTLKASQAGNGNYTAATAVNDSFAVSKAQIAAQANNQTKVQGAANPTLTITYTGFVNGDTVAVLDTLPTASTTATASSPVGTYPITLSGGLDNNYSFKLVPGTLTVTASSANQAFLRKLFVDVLGRPINPDELAGYSAALAGGETRAAVLGDLLDSSEYSQRQIEPAIRLYQAATTRAPDYAGLQNSSSALHGGVLTLAGAADQIAATAEFQQRYGALDNTQYVQQLYRTALGHEADAASLAGWVGRLNAGASRGTVLVGLSESDEFKGNVADQVEILRLHFLLLQRMPTTAELQSWQDFLLGSDETASAAIVEPDLVSWAYEFTALDDQMREELLADPAFNSGG